MRSPRFVRFGFTSHLAAALLASLALLLSAGAAAAHVGILPSEAPPNTSVVFTARVPTEQQSPTVRLRIEFPAGVTVSRFQPKPGWQRSEERDASGRITSATWSGGQIQAGEFDEFVFQARTPAEAGTLRFRAFQTYGNGNTVEWVNEADPGLAPAVNIRAAASTAAATGDHGQAVAAAGAAGTVSATTAAGASGAAGAAATAVRPAVSASTAPAASGAGAQAGSDLPLFIALGSGALALVSLALAAMALARRPAPSAVTASERAA